MPYLPKLVTELGLGAALSIMMFIAFFFLLKWVLGVSKEQLQQMTKEREGWGVIQLRFTEELKDIQILHKENRELNRSFHNEVKDAHTFQREEHKEMIKALGRINGYKE